MEGWGSAVLALPLSSITGLVVFWIQMDPCHTYEVQEKDTLDQRNIIDFHQTSPKDCLHQGINNLHVSRVNTFTKNNKIL